MEEEVFTCILIISVLIFKMYMRKTYKQLKKRVNMGGIDEGEINDFYID